MEELRKLDHRWRFCCFIWKYNQVEMRFCCFTWKYKQVEMFLVSCNDLISVFTFRSNSGQVALSDLHPRHGDEASHARHFRLVLQATPSFCASWTGRLFVSLFKVTHRLWNDINGVLNRGGDGWMVTSRQKIRNTRVLYLLAPNGRLLVVWW